MHLLDAFIESRIFSLLDTIFFSCLRRKLSQRIVYGNFSALLIRKYNIKNSLF